MMSDLAGTGALVRLALRRDRIVLPVWIVAVVGVTASTASALPALYPTQAERTQFALTIQNNVTFRALSGRIYDDTTIGAFVAWRLAGLAAAMLALMSVFNVIRHTRAEEESGRLELLGSTVVGRRAPLTASLLVMFGANLIAGLAIVASLVGMGEAAAGSLAFGLAVAGCGIVFGGLAALAAQLTDGARTALGIGSGGIIAAFVLRAIADSASPTGPDWLSWLSPIGWSQQVRAFAGDKWQVFGLMVVVFAVCVGAAFALTARRDIGAGLFATRPGPARAARSLSGVGGLALRMQRGSLVAWVVGFALMGIAYGSLGSGIGDLVTSSPQFEQVFRQLGGTAGIQDAFYAAIYGIVTLIAAAYAVSATLRLRSEETSGRVEPLLATRASRTEWVLSHLVFALGGSALLMAVLGAATGLTYGLTEGGVGKQVLRMTGSALAQVPAVWVVAGLALLIIGVLPRLAVAAWGALAAFVLVGQVGSILQLNQILIDISPFSHSPKLPGAQVIATPILILLVVAVVLVGAGIQLVKRRDIG